MLRRGTEQLHIGRKFIQLGAFCQGKKGRNRKKRKSRKVQKEWEGQKRAEKTDQIERAARGDERRAGFGGGAMMAGKQAGSIEGIDRSNHSGVIPASSSNRANIKGRYRSSRAPVELQWSSSGGYIEARGMP